MNKIIDGVDFFKNLLSDVANGNRNKQYVYARPQYINNKLNYQWINNKTKRTTYKKIKQQENKSDDN